MVADKDYLIESQAELIRFLQKQKEVLEKKVAMFEAMFMGRVVESRKRFKERAETLSRLDKMTYDVIHDLCMRYKRWVSNKEIDENFRKRYPAVKPSPDTISRRARALVQEGLIERKIIEGKARYYPVLEEVSEQ